MLHRFKLNVAMKEGRLTMAKKKIGMEYMGKPLYRKGDRIIYGNLEDEYILVLDIVEKTNTNGIDVATKVKLQIQDNTGEHPGEGKAFRQSEKSNLYKALDIGAWWLKQAVGEV